MVPMPLMPIARFSTLSRISVRMLRHYDAQGVLRPASIDAATGYRYYAPHQVADAATVRDLRDVGFSVAAMSVLLAVRGTPAWANALAVQGDVLAQALAEAKARVALLEQLRNHGGNDMPMTLSRTTLPAMTVVTLRGVVPSYADEHLLWEQIQPLLAEQSIAPTGPCGVIEHNDEFTEHNVDLSIFLPVDPQTRVQAPLELVELPERDCLVAHVRGPYSQIGKAHDLIGQRLAEENLAVRNDGTVASKAFNIYLNTPGEVSPDELLTQVCEPLA